jgi:hypothetical protein
MDTDFKKRQRNICENRRHLWTRLAPFLLSRLAVVPPANCCPQITPMNADCGKKKEHICENLWNLRITSLRQRGARISARPSPHDDRKVTGRLLRIAGNWQLWIASPTRAC